MRLPPLEEKRKLADNIENKEPVPVLAHSIYGTAQLDVWHTGDHWWFRLLFYRRGDTPTQMDFRPINLGYSPEEARSMARLWAILRDSLSLTIEAGDRIALDDGENTYEWNVSEENAFSRISWA